MCTINSSALCRAFILMIHVHHSTCILHSFNDLFIKLMNVQHFMTHLVLVTTHIKCLVPLIHVLICNILLIKHFKKLNV